MTWLNYHHLLYFWTVFREGGVTEAAKKLRLATPTISLQLRALEEALGEKLFEKRGRRLALTEMGHVVFRYAEEIFALGRELQDAVRTRTTVRPARLFVGVANAVPKLVAYRVLEPALRLEPRVELAIVEDRPERLMAELASYSLDVVLTDAQQSTPSVRAYHHPLGESPVGIFGATRLAARFRRGFPASLDGAPFLVPTLQSSLRRALDAWFERSRVRPAFVGEFDDMALLKVFAAQGKGLFAAPTVISADLRARYGASLVGETSGVRERFYAVTLERRIQNPAVAALTSAARTRLFGD